MQLYLRHLRDADSVIAVHISNRYLDLDPVVRGLAEALDLAVIRIDDEQNDERVFASDWMLLAPHPAAFARLLQLADSSEGPAYEGPWPLWTDAYSNLVQVFKE